MASHDPSACAATDHTYWNLTVFRCPHRQQIHVRRSKYLETGTELDPVDYTTTELVFGPFDSADDVVSQLRAWVMEWRADWE